ncbi:hypothetical protein M3Y97_00362700 [Aphelenchoides bicaudatus]|nr:hypothetical protein M3Y97_00362700 [Aphelenchoides bicaudatus]
MFEDVTLGATNQGGMANWDASFGVTFFVVLFVLAIPAILLTITVYLCDAITSGKHIGTNTISIDPKGFSTNELYLLNAKQCKDGCQMRKVGVTDRGPLKVHSSDQLMLPSTPVEDVQCTTDRLLATDASKLDKKKPLNILRIYEYHISET